MFKYSYGRALVNDLYNINNQYHIDGEEKQILLYMDIENEGSLPTQCQIKCNATVCDIFFETELTPEQETILNTLVATHKNYT
jgi:hypothetical protein